MSISRKYPKIVVILGPNASGKSELAVRLAKKFNGEIISADSRQVYKGLDIGSGKVPRDKPPKSYILNSSAKGGSASGGKSSFLYKGVPHHLLDIANPKRVFTVAQFQKAGKKIIQKLFAIGHLPIICGGTGLYVDSLLYDTKFPEVKPNAKLRRKLEKKSNEELFEMLQKLDSRRAATIDRHNKRRLIRTLEIISYTGKPVPLFASQQHTNILKYAGMLSLKILKIGIQILPVILKKRIRTRLAKRLREGMVEEVANLHRKGISWKRLDDLGLEYRYISRYLRGLHPSGSRIQPNDTRIKTGGKQKFGRNSMLLDKNSGVYNAMISAIERESWHYAKRQMTWWKRDKEIVWIQNQSEARKLVGKFLE